MRKSSLPVWMGALLLAVGLISTTGCESKGTAGANGTSCTATKTGTTTTISCTDGTSVAIEDGAKGATGDKGAVGDTGATGATGAKGDTGAQGAKGDKGETGANSTPCAVVDNGNGTKTVTCGTTSVTLSDGATGTAGVDGKDGKDGADGQPCQVADNGNGTKTITCAGVTVDLPVGNTGATGETGAQGEPGVNGTDGLPGKNGVDAKPCTVADKGGGVKLITCADGSTVTVSDGAATASFVVTNFHGINVLMTTGEYALGAKSLGTAKITAASVDPDSGKVTVTYTVKDAKGAAVTGLKAVGLAVARLQPPANGEASSQWVPYIYSKATAGTGEWNNAPYNTDPAFYTYQATRESSNADPAKGGTLTESATTPGTYTYVSLVNLKTAKKETTTVGFNASQTHRVTVMMGGHAGLTADASFDFVPNGDPVSYTRDIVQTDSCKECHGPLFKAHGGDRLSVETCVQCHNPSTIDPQSKNTIDLKVMIHKIHAGTELQSTAGADGIVFDNPATVANEAADNSQYTIWGYNYTKISFWDVEFPAIITNCTKCHQGTGADVNAWKNSASAATCTSCHDKVDPVVGTGHLAGANTDAECTFCHSDDKVPFTSVGAHDWVVKDARNISEYNVAMTVVAPANGQFFVAGETPKIRVALKDMLSEAAIDLTAVKQDDVTTDEGCLKAGCAADDGKFSGFSLFVHGPRAENKPVLSYAARAAILASGVGPFNLKGAKSLVITFDGGKDVWGTDVTGGDFNKAAIVTVAIPATAAFADYTKATAAELVTLFNKDTKFSYRGIAYIDELSGKFAIRSRNLGEFYAVQLAAAATPSDPVAQVFAADTAVHPIGPLNSTAGMSTVSNKLFSAYVGKCAAGANIGLVCYKATEATDCPASTCTIASTNFVDPKVAFTAGYVEYTLDPVGDLPAGTYVANVEIKNRGSAKVCISGANVDKLCAADADCGTGFVTGSCASGVSYKTPSVGRVTFQIGTATEEKPIAGNCNSCHQSNEDTLLPNGKLSPDGKKGFVFDFSGHHKLFDFYAAGDMCTACHDWEGQSATGDWSGAKPIARRVHSVHFGANLNYPNTTVGHSDGDPGRNWDIAYPQDIRNCQQCHPDGLTSGSWQKKPSRVACMACHDSDAATAHAKTMTFDLTPANPFSGDEVEGCATCHAVK